MSIFINIRSQLDGRTEKFVRSLVYKNTAVYINHYVRMSVMISFLAT